MYLQFHSLKEPSKNHAICVRDLFGSLRGRVRFNSCFLRIFFLSGSGLDSVLGTKRGFCFGSFLLGSSSFPSLVETRTGRNGDTGAASSSGCQSPSRVVHQKKL